MEQSIVRVGTHLVFVNEAFQKLVVNKHNLRLLFKAFHVVFGNFGC